MKELAIGTRGSALALWQARYVQGRLQRECGVDSRLVVVKTTGDRILDVPLASLKEEGAGKGLFTKELEEKLLEGEIDLAVHSLKDVPTILPESLVLACITEREDARDCFLSYRYSSLAELAEAYGRGRGDSPLDSRESRESRARGRASVGTTSLRRSMQIHSRYPSITCSTLRGNVQTRLSKLASGEFDAIILASAGLKRLGITGIPYIRPLSVEEMVPAMGQAALGVECREGDSALRALLARLHCDTSALCVEAEREFVRLLEGGCQVPLGVHCRLVAGGEELLFEAVIGLPDGSRIMREVRRASAQEALRTARELAGEFLSLGARELLLAARAGI